ncbi:unnamed protein product [Calypogeia fissa]
MSAEKLFHGSDRTCNGAADRRERELRSPVTVTRRRIVTFGVIAIIFILFVAETNLQKVMVLHNNGSMSLQPLSRMAATQFGCQDLELYRLQSSTPNAKFDFLTRPTVQEAYESTGRITHVANLTSRRKSTDPKLKTVIEPNRNIKEFGLTVVRNVCMRPDGPIVMVGISGAEILKQFSKVSKVEEDWFSSYNSTQKWEGVGYEEMAVDDVPADVRWVSGTTTHILPYLGNVFHQFSDRLWPHIVGFQYPLNETSGHPIHHFLVHRFSTWLRQAEENMERNTLMYQIRILGELAPNADFLAMDGLEQQSDLVCYERLVLACATCDRMSGWLGADIARPALLRYRHAALSYFGISEPAISLPPRPLRVTFYARGDTKRRRVTNVRQVVDHLRRYRNPPMDVTVVDELMAAGEYNQSLPEVVSLLSQTDIFITVHGANTWATLFMPKHSGVIEIEGPCGPSSWIELIVDAVGLKHERSNPWGERVASPVAGNVTECKGPYETPDFTVDIQKLQYAIHQIALPTFGFNDILTRHWLHKRVQ